MNDFSEMWDFDVLEGVRFEHANRVHPLMQKTVDRIVDMARKDANIERLILFGSSLELRCNSYSDIDLYVDRFDSNIKIPQFHSVSDKEIDVLYDLDKTGRLYYQFFLKKMKMI